MHLPAAVRDAHRCRNAIRIIQVVLRSAVLEGLEADVVTFNQATDITALEKGGAVKPGWQSAFPNGASPYYSFPAFLVRAGNPKGIKDWGDLARDDVQAVFPNPKTSGNARHTYLAAYAWALKANGGDQEKAKAFVRTVLSHVPVFDTGGRGATRTVPAGASR